MSPVPGLRGMILVPRVGPSLPLRDSVQPAETTPGQLDFGSFQIRQTDIRNLAALLKTSHFKQVTSLPRTAVSSPEMQGC